MIEAVRAVKNDNNEYNLQFLKDGEWLFLYDNSSIRESVRKEVESWNIPEETEIVILIGVGLGYHAIDLINLKAKGRKIKLFFIEPVEIISQLSNKIFHLNSTLRSFVYIYGNKKQIQQGLLSLAKRIHIKLRKVKFLVPDNYIKFFPNEVKDVIDIIKSLTLENAIKIGNSIDDTILGIYNMFRNSQSISKSLPLKALKNYYNGYPIVIVSAGPSLNKNIHVLKKYQDRVVIIATDATFKMLIEKGIRVDFVTVLERDYITYNKFFENLKYDKTPTLVYQSVAWPDIAASFKNSKVVTFKTLPTEEKFGKFISEDYISIPSGSSVATMSISLANVMGAKYIILIGQDLAYSEDGYTHADGVSVKKKQNIKNAIELDGINGKKVKSTVLWRNFKLEIEDLIRINNLNVIDATEGGALIQGTKIMSLEEVLNPLPNIDISYEFKSIDIDSNAILEKIRSFKDYFLQVIDDSIGILREQKKLNARDWDNFMLHYSKAEKCFYFSHFHGLNSALIMRYHNSDQDDKIYPLISMMIDSSELLKEYINMGFKIGKKYSFLLSKLKDLLLNLKTFEDECTAIQFMLGNRFPFKAAKFLEAMEKKYNNDNEKLSKIYRFLIVLNDDYAIEKASATNKVIYYFLKVLKIDKNTLNDKNIIDAVSRNIEIIFEDYKLFYKTQKIQSNSEIAFANRIIEILLILNDIEKQCEVLKFVPDNFETLEVLTARYNCLVYQNRIHDAKRLLEYIARKFPKNAYIRQELNKYK